MPLYSVSCASSLDDGMKEKLANLIMRVHCDLTGAPETFVNVIFSDNVPLRPTVQLNVLGSVRKGRTSEAKERLSHSMADAIAELTGVPASQLEMTMYEVPAQWVMEGGEILPEPGEEDQCEWLQKGHSA